MPGSPFRIKAQCSLAFASSQTRTSVGLVAVVACEYPDQTAFSRPAERSPIAAQDPYVAQGPAFHPEAYSDVSQRYLEGSLQQRTIGSAANPAPFARISWAQRRRIHEVVDGLVEIRVPSEVRRGSQEERRVDGCDAAERTQGPGSLPADE